MELRIVKYRPAYQSWFEKLNKAWLEEYFVVEPIDQWVLENPEEAILKDGGAILFAANRDKILGTVALKWMEKDAIEMTKMAVGKQYQGLGIGKFLCSAAIAEAKRLKAPRLVLYSHTSLVTALGIYRKMGFIEIPVEKGRYARADIKMEMLLNDNDAID